MRTLYPNKIIVSNKLLGLLGSGLGFGSGSFYMHEMELLHVVTSNLIGIQRVDRLVLLTTLNNIGSTTLFNAVFKCIKSMHTYKLTAYMMSIKSSIRL